MLNRLWNVARRLRVLARRLLVSEARQVKQWYANSDVQPRTYETPLPYAALVASTIASMKPASVLEFGCNAGRNLQLLRDLLPEACLVGTDLNADAVNDGKAMFGLDLRVGDDNTLHQFRDGEFDVVFTVSVLDHIPSIQQVSRELTRIAGRFLVLLEIVGPETGKALTMRNEQGEVIPGYPYTYFHDYRATFERKLGCPCILDAYVPVGRTNLLEYYRLHVFAVREAPYSGVFHLSGIEFSV